MTAIKVRVRNRSPALSTTPQESQPARARVRFFIAKIFSPFSLNASGVNSVWRKFPLADFKAGPICIIYTTQIRRCDGCETDSLFVSC
jgi:hypothetical protein